MATKRGADADANGDDEKKCKRARSADAVTCACGRDFSHYPNMCTHWKYVAVRLGLVPCGSDAIRIAANKEKGGGKCLEKAAEMGNKYGKIASIETLAVVIKPPDFDVVKKEDKDKDKETEDKDKDKDKETEDKDKDKDTEDKDEKDKKIEEMLDRLFTETTDSGCVDDPEYDSICDAFFSDDSDSLREFVMNL
jgi:hypothetical protein